MREIEVAEEKIEDVENVFHSLVPVNDHRPSIVRAISGRRVIDATRQTHFPLSVFVGLVILSFMIQPSSSSAFTCGRSVIKFNINDGKDAAENGMCIICQSQIDS